jgi:hypothetical protein
MAAVIAGNHDAFQYCVQTPERNCSRLGRLSRTIPRQNQDRYVGRVTGKICVQALGQGAAEFFGDREIKMRLLKIKIASP